jgi:hypothetical protein
MFWAPYQIVKEFPCKIRQLFYHTLQGVNSWIPISSGFTDEQGKYNIQWINSASGTFTLGTIWKGDSAFNGASNTTSLTSFLFKINRFSFLNQTAPFMH